MELHYIMGISVIFLLLMIVLLPSFSLFVLFVIIILLLLFYFYRKDGVNDTYKFDKTNYEPTPVPEIKTGKQVFHIPGNEYTYNEAKAVCKAYGAELANYNQIEKAYNKGAEWCSYGWTADQLALFPTQKSTFDRLKQIKGHENDCGRPGINGGYMPNDSLKFGATCYGFKPKMTANDMELMHVAEPYPESEEDVKFNEMLASVRAKLSSIVVSPFNKYKWSEI